MLQPIGTLLDIFEVLNRGILLLIESEIDQYERSSGDIFVIKGERFKVTGIPHYSRQIGNNKFVIFVDGTKERLESLLGTLVELETNND